MHSYVGDDDNRNNVIFIAAVAMYFGAKIQETIKKNRQNSRLRETTPR